MPPEFDNLHTRNMPIAPSKPTTSRDEESYCGTVGREVSASIPPFGMHKCGQRSSEKCDSETVTQQLLLVAMGCHARTSSAIAGQFALVDMRSIVLRRIMLKFVVVAIASQIATQAASSYRNIYGDDLQSCSSEGMALTGYTRNGFCIDQNDDQGSHHICIDLSSAQGGNFCEVTGQSNWCSNSMPCHEDPSESCQIQNWCVCQWAFASYLANAGGCDQIQDIVCESINLEALIAYRNHRNDGDYNTALACIMDRCSIADEQLDQIIMVASNQSTLSSAITGTTILLTLVASIVVFQYLKRRGHQRILDGQIQHSLMQDKE